MPDLSCFSDIQWARSEPLLSGNTCGLKRVDELRVLSGIVGVLRSGGRWIDAPADYGPGKALSNRFQRLADRGIEDDIVSTHRFFRHMLDYMHVPQILRPAAWWFR